jgi:AcrR family transcriptional regulator
MVEKPALRADARRNRERVLGAAEAAFAAEGLAVPLDEIARRAGVGAGTVYRHFPSKEALFEAVVVEQLEQFAAQARELLGASDPGEAFFGYFRRVVRQVSLNRALCDALDASFKTSAADDFRDAVVELFRLAQQAGAVRADIDGPDLRALVVGCVAAERHAPSGDHIVGVVIDGMRAKHPGSANEI